MKKIRSFRLEEETLNRLHRAAELTNRKDTDYMEYAIKETIKADKEKGNLPETV